MSLIVTRGFGELSLVCPVTVEAATDDIEIDIETGVISVDIDLDSIEITIEVDE